MPDILILGMEMPKRCDASCPIYNINKSFYDCRITKQYYNWGLTGRPSDCPLVELPPHGDLVDVNTAYDKIAERETSYYMDMDGVDAGLQATPIIVPASEEATNG